jgi:hypothetical protein
LAPSVSVAGSSATTWGNGPSLALNNFSVPSGTDRLLVVSTRCQYFDNTSVNSMTFTFGGSSHSLTKALSVSTRGGSSEIWYYMLGDSSTPTTGDISISFNGSAYAGAVATLFFGVNQTAVITGTTASGPSASALTVTSTPGDMVLDATAGQTTADAPGPGQTLQGYDFDGINYWGAVSTAPGAASVTMSWSQTFLENAIAHAAIDIPTATPLTLTMTTLSAPAISYGTNGSITVTVHSNGGTPTGNVSLSVDNSTPLTQALTGGQTVFTIPGLHAGDHSLSASYAGEGNYWVSSATDKLTVNPATLTASILGTPTKTYDGAISAALTSSNYSLSGLEGTDSFTVTQTTGSYNSKDVATASTVSTPLAGTDFTAGAGTRASDYTLPRSASGPGAITPRPLTITANSTSKSYGQTVSFAGTEFSVGATTTTPPAGLVNGEMVGKVTLTSAGAAATATVAFPGPNYLIIPSAAMGTSLENYTISYINGTLTVSPAPLSATAVNISATAGAPFSGPVATFTNVSPNTIPYTAVIDWGDGSTSACSISVSGSSLTVTGSHTYADPKSYSVSVQISNPNTMTAKVTDTATVTSLGQGVVKGLAAGIGFWHNSNGQALLTSLNGGASATALSAWLAATFPNLYGANAGSNNLSGKSNAQVAAYFLSLFNLAGTKVQAQVLATALNVYASTSSLGGNAAAAYGFSVSATGLGACSYNVGSDGAAFGVANNTTCNVYQLLLAVNRKAVNGVLYNGTSTLQAQAADLFNALNQAGSI